MICSLSETIGCLSPVHPCQWDTYPYVSEHLIYAHLLMTGCIHCGSKTVELMDLCDLSKAKRGINETEICPSSDSLKYVRHSPNFLQYSYGLNVFRCKAPPGSCAAETQFPELDHKGSDLVLNCIPVANVLIYREDGFMVSMVCGVILGIFESSRYFSWKSFLCYSFWRENTLFVKYIYIQRAPHGKGQCFASVY